MRLSARSRRKLWEWVKRYLPAQILGTIVALVVAQLAYQLTHSLGVAAYASTVAEAVAYYGVASVRDIIAFYERYHPHHTLKRLWLTTLSTGRSLIMEFGVAGTLDGGFIRPYLMWVLPQLTGNMQLGWLIAKVVADVIFYSMAITGYELHKRKFMQPAPALVPLPVVSDDMTRSARNRMPIYYVDSLSRQWL